MKKWSSLLWIAAFLLLTAGLWWKFSPGEKAEDQPESDAQPTPQVEVATLHRGAIERKLVAYGSTVVSAAGTRSISLPLECRVVAVLANPGQSVAAGDALLEVEPSAEAKLALETALRTEAGAASALQDVQRRFQSRLATNQELVGAQGAAQDARLKLESLQNRGLGTDGIVRAPAAGIVTKVLAQPGAINAAGAPMAEIAVERRLQAKLGISPPDAGEIKVGQEVTLLPVETREEGPQSPLAGHVLMVGQSVDPSTRLVDALVKLDAPDGSTDRVLIGSFLRAEITVEKKEALLAPREAVLPDAEGAAASLFTIQDGHAKKHQIKTGLDDGRNIEITGGAEGLSSGSGVVTTGAYELKDGMPLTVDGKPGGTP